MQISEKELEDYIFEDLTCNAGMTLSSRGLRTQHGSLLTSNIICKAKWLRQVDLGPYGRADIIGFFRHKNTIIVELFELKIVPIDINDFEQICRYKKGIQHYFGERFNIDFRMYLVGSDFKSGHYLHNNIYDLEVVVFEYSLTGLFFDRHKGGGWHRPDGNSFNYLKSLHHAEEIHGYR